MMTFEEFCASKRWSENLESENIGADDVHWPGYIYAELCYIEQSVHGGTKEWILVIGNAQYARPHEDLEELEAILYEEWYVHEAAELDKIHSD